MRTPTISRAGSAAAWAALAAVAAAATSAACEEAEPPVTLTSTGVGTPAGTATGAGGVGGSPSTGAMGGFTPDPDPCVSHAGELICVEDVALTCDESGHTEEEHDCAPDVCVPGTGCQLCVPGQYSCWGTGLRLCSAGPPLQWQAVDTCDTAAGEGCNPTTGACEVLQPIGRGPTEPTGTYYQYARFTLAAGPFLGGCDIDSKGNYLYVNRGPWYVDGSTLDVYAVELLDSDGDGEFEPNQHPDNPDAIGPVEARVLTHVTSYAVAALGTVHHAEVYAVDDRVFLLSTLAGPGEIFEFIFGAGTTNTIVSAPTPALDLAQLGYDDVHDHWYASNEWNRRVYSYHEGSNTWVAEFAYPNLAGDHMDGLEVVTDPNTGTVYVYVSDMTSDFLGQYRRDRGSSWLQVNLFEYQGTGEPVEGMGFGALNHFWITSGSPSGVDDVLYEIGGGDLSKYTEPTVPPT